MFYFFYIRSSSCKKGSLLWPGASQWIIYYHRMWVQLSTTCSNFTEVSQWGAPSCSQPKSATDNGVRDGRSNWLVAPTTIHRAVHFELHVLHTAMRARQQITRLTALSQPRTCDLRSARPTHCLCGRSGYEWIRTDRSIHFQPILQQQSERLFFILVTLTLSLSTFNSETDHKKCEIALGGRHCGQRFFYTGTPASHETRTYISSMTCILHRPERYHLYHRGITSIISSLWIKKWMWC